MEQLFHAKTHSLPIFLQTAHCAPTPLQPQCEPISWVVLQLKFLFLLSHVPQFKIMWAHRWQVNIFRSPFFTILSLLQPHWCFISSHKPIFLWKSPWTWSFLLVLFPRGFIRPSHQQGPLQGHPLVQPRDPRSPCDLNPPPWAVWWKLVFRLWGKWCF